MTTGSASKRLDLSFTLVADVEVPPGVASDKLESLATFVLAAEGATGIWEITVALVDDARLQSLHRDFMGIDTPTDIDLSGRRIRWGDPRRRAGNLCRSRHDAGGDVGTFT